MNLRPPLPSALGALLLAGCCTAPPAAGPRVVLLPAADGRPSAVVMTPKSGAPVEIDQPWASIEPGAAGQPPVRRQLDEAAVRARWGGLLEARPPTAQVFVYAFDVGSDAVPPALAADLPRLRATFDGLPGAEAVVTGHTDATGNAQANDALSLRRAERVRAALVEAGWPPERVSAVGRGARQPLPGDRNAAEQRRVEVKLR